MYACIMDEKWKMAQPQINRQKCPLYEEKFLLICLLKQFNWKI